MKNSKLIALLASILCSISVQAATQTASSKRNLMKELDSLGSNQAIVDRAQAIDGENKIRVVQKRKVDRDLRFEFAVGYDAVSGGDSYIQTNNLGYMLDFHINPRVSVGARYYDSYNELTSEGERVFADARRRQAAGDLNSLRPDVDNPLSSTLGTITVYPLYGKLNFFNLGVTQFDVYLMGGYGQMELSSGSTPTWTAGGGVGIWWAQHVSSRLEARYQDYQDKIYSGSRDQSMMAFSFSIGILL